MQWLLTGMKRCLLLGIACAALAAPRAGRAEYQDVVYYPTTWYYPTGWSVTGSTYVPTTTRYYLTGATYVPTSYVVPSTYTPTRYVETVYQEPRGLSRLFGPRQWTSTSWSYYGLTPTSYVSVAPTTYRLTPTRYVPTAYVTDPCDTVVGSADATVDPNATSATRQNSGTTGGGTPPRAVQSTPKNGSNSNQGAGDNSSVPQEPGFDDTRPGGPVPDEPTGGGLQTPTGSQDNSVQRSAMRPRPTELNPQTNSVPVNALRGEVAAATDGKPVPSVRVVFSDARQTYRDRATTTDVNGRFHVVLPNGDWTVAIEDATGKLTPYGNITSTNGRFLDEGDRVVSSLRLNR